LVACLAATFVYGVLGLVLYLVARLALQRVLTMHEAGS
jgi:ABC-type nitrate/sulfonate/bicarbonate transport system permease component